MHGNTRLLFDCRARPYFRPGVQVLEVGSDLPSTLQRLIADESIQWHTVDWRLSAKLALPIERPYDTAAIGKKLGPQVA